MLRSSLQKRCISGREHVLQPAQRAAAPVLQVRVVYLQLGDRNFLKCENFRHKHKLAYQKFLLKRRAQFALWVLQQTPALCSAR